MRRMSVSLCAVAALAAGVQVAGAASLQVAPLLVEVPAPGAASNVTLRNEGPRSVNAQVRVFRWTQEDGEDVLEPTDAVVASPPSAALASRADYLLRVVRTSRGPVAQEEAYRLLVDEIPDATEGRPGTIAMVLRHSVPVFFTPQEAEGPQLRWSTEVKGGQLHVTAVNEGGRRVRVAGLKVSDGKSTVSFGNGLTGYALAGSSVTWVRPVRGFNAAAAKISAQGDLGPIVASARPEGR